MVGPEDAGPRMFERLILPRAEAAYRPLSHKWPTDPTHLVHETRVACRRLVEALALVEPALPEDLGPRLKRNAKRLRRALGARREADVMKADFEALLARAKLPTDTGAVVTQMMLRHGDHELTRAREHFSTRRLRRRLDRVEAAAALVPKRRQLRELAAPHLFQRALEPEDKIACLEQPEASAEHHALRIHFKRLRYGLEMLLPVFPDAFDRSDMLDVCKELQEGLGVVQDANDLLSFLGAEALRAHVDETSLDILRDYARAEREQRREHAARVVRELAPDLLGATRRAAGRIGQLELI